MQVIPVVDLLRRQVVRGVGGRREEYRPIVSTLTPGSSPAEVAAALVARFHFAEVYVADLDAIQGGQPDWQSHDEIARCGLRPWIDAGIDSLAGARRLLEQFQQRLGRFRLVAGLETLASPAALGEIVSAVGPEQLTFSLDLKQGAALTASTHWHGFSPLEIAASAVAAGATSMILLDLADVGMSRGVATCQLARDIRRRWPALELIGGGGVRSVEDLEQLHAAGFDAALVASALHDGQLTHDDVRRAGTWRR